MEANYHGLTKFMMKHPDALLLRRFRYMQVKTLLYLQAELSQKEGDLLQLQKEDSSPQASQERQSYLTSWKAMSRDDGRDNLQWEKCREIRQLLLEYNKLVLQISQLDGRPAPTSKTLERVRRLVRDPRLGNDFLPIEEDCWNIDAGEEEYLLTSPHEMQKGVLERMTYSLGAFFLTNVSRRKDDELFEVRDSVQTNLAAMFNAMIASMAPTITILVLYSVHNMWIRIGLVIAFTACFAALLAFFTGAKKIEIFAASTAFAAVEVVFIGSTS